MKYTAKGERFLKELYELRDSLSTIESMRFMARPYGDREGFINEVRSVDVVFHYSKDETGASKTVKAVVKRFVAPNLICALSEVVREHYTLVNRAIDELKEKLYGEGWTGFGDEEDEEC